MTEVTCAHCAKRFRSIFSNHPGTARGCAAEVTQGDLIGHYGSVFDLDVLRPVPPQRLQEGDTICDRCIHVMLSQKRLLLNGGFAGSAYLADVKRILDGGPLNG